MSLLVGCTVLTAVRISRSVDLCESLTSVTQQLVLDIFEIFIAETDVQPVNMESTVTTCLYSN